MAQYYTTTTLNSLNDGGVMILSDELPLELEAATSSVYFVNDLKNEEPESQVVIEEEEQSVDVYEVSRNAKGELECPVCLANFKIIANLERHIQIHAKKFVFEIPKGNAPPRAIDGPPKLALYPCEFCDEAFEYKRHLSQHLLSHRDRQPSLKCDKCNFQTDNAARLREHSSSMHQNKKNVNEKLKCEKCRKQFKTKNLLKLHMNKAHKEANL